MAERTDFDAAVIGAGLVGSAVALGLARAGQRVVLLDEGEDGWHASGGNFGLVWVQGKGARSGAYAAWTRASADAWPDFARSLGHETGLDVAYARTGGLSLCLDEAELEARTTLIKRMHNQPPPGANDAEILDASAVRKLVPSLGPAVVGASFCPHDGHANPLLTLRALQAALTRAGGSIRRRFRVTAITKADGFQIDGQTSRIAAGRVVLAAGLGNGHLAPMVGLDAPVRPQRGQILVTQRLPELCRFACHRFRQTADGTVMLGDTQEEVGLDTNTTHSAARDLAAYAAACFPALGDARVIRQWGALRVLSPDGLPIYARSATHEGAFVVTCHSGVTLAAVHAGPLAAAIAANALPPEVASFAPDRFREAA
jgi:hydrogen cyanide synthase HcnC